MLNFRKRNVQQPVPGTRTSPHTGQVITSSGNPSLDVILGGGLPIGSICLIEEDKYYTYSKVLAKYFLAEGIASKQTVFLGSLNDDPEQFLDNLPNPICLKNTFDANESNSEPATPYQDVDAGIDAGAGDTIEEQSPNKNGLRIAWRYNDLPIVNSEPATTKIGHNFDLSQKMNAMCKRFVYKRIWNGSNDPKIDKHNRENASDDDTNDVDTIEKDVTESIEKETNWRLITEPTDDGGILVSSKNNKNLVVYMPPSIVNNTTTNPTTTTIATSSDEEIDSNNEALTSTWDKAIRAQEKLTSSLETTLSSVETSSQSETLADENSTVNLFNALSLHLYTMLQNKKFSPSTLVCRNLCRICITSLGSPQWYHDNFAAKILKFLTILRAQVRSSVAVGFITMPMHLIAKMDQSLVAKIRNLVDYSIELESFTGLKKTDPILKKYDGLLHLRKITAINTLNAYMPETCDLAYKLRRKSFVIEKLHLPPEISENDDAKPSISCASLNADGLRPKLSMDF